MFKQLKRIQKYLNLQGYDAGIPDGQWGIKTATAVQQAIGMDGHKAIGALVNVISTEPEWLIVARKYIGLKEAKNGLPNPIVTKFWQAIGMGWFNAFTAWCAAFTGSMLEQCGIKSTRSAMARSYHKWGQELDAPVVGCIIVFWRGKRNGWSGHVGYGVGRDADGNIMCLSGNQDDMVSIKPFDVDRVLSYRWPPNQTLPDTSAGFLGLPLLDSDGVVSINEA